MAGVGSSFDGNGIYVYRGGFVPGHLKQRITHARIDKSVKIIGDRAFLDCTNLLEVETHSGITKIKKGAFFMCRSLKRIKLPGVREIEEAAFQYCDNLTDVEFGVELETIGRYAFYVCRSLRRIAMPLKDDIEFPIVYSVHRRQTQFDGCENLATVDLVGVGVIHQTISSLHLESWRDEMNEEINRINRVLPYTDSWIKTATIQQWIESVTSRIEHYKTQHNTLLKEATTLLELTLWKAKLDEDKNKEDTLQVKTKKANIDVDSARQEWRITSGASVIIKNVLPFLQLA
jgi:hypothetical protein